MGGRWASAGIIPRAGLLLKTAPAAAAPVPMKVRRLDFFIRVKVIRCSEKKNYLSARTGRCPGNIQNKKCWLMKGYRMLSKWLGCAVCIVCFSVGTQAQTIQRNVPDAAVDYARLS